ncbi:hypothetical protein TIFTF001_022831 [Ficus carica]|uniref:Uncharacterized protein n=1 Tax=Ficus carica TaxID=3494 RepID=A0AA88DEW1_FICCA|nr:hypothetical protein TIFTF001_022831 [Ficus carica]
MSLVDYASSDDDDDVVPEKLADLEKASQKLSESKEKPESANSIAQPSIEKLPDASELLNSSEFSSSNALGGITDHSSLVAAAMAQSASRKRDSTATLPSSLPRSKVPKGTLPHSKNVPETVSGLLVPPQLRGSFSRRAFICMNAGLAA